MRGGTETALARVAAVFGAAKPHHACLFANRGANRMKVLVHDGIGVWLAARRLNRGKFVWPNENDATRALTRTARRARSWLTLAARWRGPSHRPALRQLPHLPMDRARGSRQDAGRDEAEFLLAQLELTNAAPHMSPSPRLLDANFGQPPGPTSDRPSLAQIEAVDDRKISAVLSKLFGALRGLWRAKRPP